MRTTDRALRILAAAPAPMTAGELGAELWDQLCPRNIYKKDYCFGRLVGRASFLATCAACGWIGNWPKRHGRAVSADGGGDYAAQMLLGRLRKAGLVRGLSDINGRGATRWMLTEAGRFAAVAAAARELESATGRALEAAGRARAEIEGRTPEPRMPKLRRRAKED